jgi:hypothetical protein
LTSHKSDVEFNLTENISDGKLLKININKYNNLKFNIIQPHTICIQRKTPISLDIRGFIYNIELGTPQKGTSSPNGSLSAKASAFAGAGALLAGFGVLNVSLDPLSRS